MIGVKMWGNRFTNNEQRFMEYVLQTLEQVAWAEPLRNLIKARGGISKETQPELFEARVAFALLRKGITPIYEYRAGIGESSVDFKLPGTPEFLVEVVSFRASQGVKRAAKQDGPFTIFDLSSFNLNIEGKEAQSIESEHIVAQSKLGEKVFADRKNTKFPPPQQDRYHVILVDCRGFLGGNEEMRYLREDLAALLYGASGFHIHDSTAYELRMSIPQPGGPSVPFIGLFEENAQHPLKAAKHLQERIHFIHFVCEQEFKPEELTGKKIGFVVSNRALVTSDQMLQDILKDYPLLDP